jgi:hypothetical protein
VNIALDDGGLACAEVANDQDLVEILADVRWIRVIVVHCCRSAVPLVTVGEGQAGENL